MANPFQQWYHADFLRVCKRKKLNFAQKSAYAMFLHELWECQGYLDSDPYELAHQLGLKSSDCSSPFSSERLSDPSSVADSIAKALLKMELIQVTLHPETEEECYCQERILEDMGKISSKSKTNSASGKMGALARTGVIVKDEITKAYHYADSGKKFDFEEFKKSEGLSERLPKRLSKGAEAYHNHNHNHNHKRIESVGSLEVYDEIKNSTHAQPTANATQPKDAKEVESHANQFFKDKEPTQEKCENFFNHWEGSGWMDSNLKLINWKQKLGYYLDDANHKKIVVSKKSESKPIITDYYESPVHTDEELDSFEENRKNIKLPWKKAE